MKNIEDETSFICVCPKFDIEITDLFNLVANKCKKKKSKLIFLLSNEDTEIVLAVAFIILTRQT